MITTS